MSGYRYRGVTVVSTMPPNVSGGVAAVGGEVPPTHPGLPAAGDNGSDVPSSDLSDDMEVDDTGPVVVTGGGNEGGSTSGAGATDATTTCGRQW